MSKDEALKLALDALDEFCELGAIIRPLEVRDALREALAEQPAQQEPEHIVHSNGRYSPLLTRMMNERVKSNVKQVIELYDSPDQPAQYSDIVSDGGLDPRNKFDKPAQQEPWCMKMNGCKTKCEDCPDYVPPAAQRTWVEMSDVRIKGIFSYHGQFASGKDLPMLRVIEAMLKENASPQRTWVGLAEVEITTSLPYSVTRDKGCFHAGALWAEAKLKEKNT